MIHILILYVGLLGTRTIGALSKVDQAAGQKKALSAVQALLVNQGPRIAADIQWIATIGHSVAIASVQAEVGSETSAETSWRAERDSLISVLGGAPESKLGREALIDSLAKQMGTRIQVRLPNLLNRYKTAPAPGSQLLKLHLHSSHISYNCSLQGKSEIVQ
jgi:dynamin 1/3